MQASSFTWSRRAGLALAVCALSGIVSTAAAASAIVGPPISIGQTGVATPDPYVPVPPVAPCVVKLYGAGSATGTFDDYANHAFNYRPPASCAGPWNKVVFKADFNVSKGLQFDRTAALWIGGVNLYFGTTQEPRSAVSPSWHVERDVTELSSLLAHAHVGTVALYNIFDSTYNGSITGSAEIDFYPASANYPAANSPDMALGLVGDPAGTYAYVNTDGTPLARSIKLPRNVERAYLDVTAEPQSGDEFWYSCAPDAYADLTGCGGTAFREVEVSIDGRPAGIAPVSGWVYTGGIDPYLWRPVPGVQTLNFLPFRIDLTPFAALLDDGKAHTVAVGVATGDAGFQNTSQYFATAANLLVYLDHGSKQLTGGLSFASDSGVHPLLQSTASDDGTQFGFNVRSSHNLRASGYLNTSHGQVNVVAQQTVSFSNVQSVIATDTRFDQAIDQHSSAQSTSYAYGSGISVPTHQVWNWSFPLHMDINYVVANDGSAKQVTTVNQGFTLVDNRADAGGSFSSTRSQQATPSDTLNWDTDGNFAGPSGQHGAASYLYQDSTGACWSRSVSAAAGAVTAVVDGSACGGQ